jgi:acetyl esterase/lipase
MKKLVPVLTVVLVVVLGCTPGAAPTPEEAAPTSTSTFVQPTPSYSVEVAEDIEYLRLLEPDAPLQKLDVYAPTAPGPWPVVVVMHAWFQSKDATVYSSIAEEIAGRGVVVFVPERRSPCALLSECTDENGRALREVHESWACAVRLARERAADFGGEPGWMTVFGHGGAGLETALLGDYVQQAWGEFAVNRGGPPVQAECLSAEESAHVDAYIGYGGEYAYYERLSESDPELWGLVSFFGLIGRGPSLRVHLVFGDMDNPAFVEKAEEYHEDLVNAGYDATLTLLPQEGWQIPWSGPSREALIQLILDVARR